MIKLGAWKALWPFVALFGVSACQTLGDNISARRGLEYRIAETEGGPLPLHLNAYAPAATCEVPRPTVVYLHGGSFVLGDRYEGEHRGHARLFVEAGYNFVTIDYRRLGDDPVAAPAYLALTKDQAGHFPQRVLTTAAAATEDAAQALGWIETHAEDLCHEPQNLVLMGGSSGAIVALNLTYALDEGGIEPPEVRGVISDCGGYLRDGSVERGDVPAFLVHGLADPLIPADQTVQTWDQLQAAQTRAQLYLYEGAGHCVNLHEEQVDGVPLSALMVQFVDQVTRRQPVPVVEQRDLQATNWFQRLNGENL